MELKDLGSKPPQIHFQNGANQYGHFMWFRGSPFVAWNCDDACKERLRSQLHDESSQCTCSQCGAVYEISMQSQGVHVRESPRIH